MIVFMDAGDWQAPSANMSIFKKNSFPKKNMDAVGIISFIL